MSPPTHADHYAEYVEEIKRVARSGGRPAPQNLGDLCDDHDHLQKVNADLLEALRACEKRLLEYGRIVRSIDTAGEASEWWANDDPEGGHYLNDETWEQARAAIAKAGGK